MGSRVNQEINLVGLALCYQLIFAWEWHQWLSHLLKTWNNTSSIDDTSRIPQVEQTHKTFYLSWLDKEWSSLIWNTRPGSIPVKASLAHPNYKKQIASPCLDLNLSTSVASPPGSIHQHVWFTTTDNSWAPSWQNWLVTLAQSLTTLNPFDSFPISTMHSRANKPTQKKALPKVQKRTKMTKIVCFVSFISAIWFSILPNLYALRAHAPSWLISNLLSFHFWPILSHHMRPSEQPLPPSSNMY